MNISEATRIVKERQDAFLRGEMPNWEIEWLKETYPNAIPDWLRMKMNLLVRIAKFRKQLLTIVRVSVRKGNCVKRFGAADERSTLKKQGKRLGKLERKYGKSGCSVLLTWNELWVEVSLAANSL